MGWKANKLECLGSPSTYALALLSGNMASGVPEGQDWRQNDTQLDDIQQNNNIQCSSEIIGTMYNLNVALSVAIQLLCYLWLSRV